MTATLSKESLEHFQGSERLYPLLLTNLRCTEGVKHVAEAGKAHWLVTDLCSFRLDDRIKSKPHDYEFWSLTVANPGPEGARSAVLSCCLDDDETPVFTHEYRHTDFPLSEIVLWVEHDDVLLLPSEY